jgi:hypothetical protein
MLPFCGIDVSETCSLYLQDRTPLQNLTFMDPCIVIIILTYIQQDATLHSLFYLETALHVSGGTSTNLQERKQMYLHHLVLVTP